MRIWKQLALAVGVLLLAAAAWSHRAWLFASMAPAQAPPIQFDNGTVRAERPDPIARGGLSHGQMRKCTGKREILYADRECPPGYVETPVNASGRVTVLAGQGGAKPAAAAAPAATASRATLYDVLDMRPDPALRERVMEQAASGERR